MRDVRNLRLPAGSFDLQFMDIAATVNPATVHFRSLTEPARARRARAELRVRPARTGQAAAQVRRPRGHAGAHAAGGRHRRARRKCAARLLSYNNGPVWQIGKEIVTGLHADHIRFPELPGNLLQPADADLDAARTAARTAHRVEASYLAGKLAWNADYVLTVARDDKAADLDGWVTLTNGSGTAFNNAKLQLVAGDLNRVRQELERAARRDGRAACRRARRRRRWRRRRSPTITSTRSAGGRRSTTTRPSRSRCSPAPASRRSSATSSTAGLLLPERPASGRADQGRRAGVLSVQERAEGRPRHADAGRHDPRLPGGLARAACSSSAKTASTTRRRTRRSTSRSATPSTSSASGSRPTSARSRRTSTSSSTRSRCATTRAARCHVEVNEPIGGDLGDAPVVAQVDEDRRVGRAVRRAGRRRWRGDAQVPGASHVLSRASEIGELGPTPRARPGAASCIETAGSEVAATGQSSHRPLPRCARSPVPSLSPSLTRPVAESLRESEVPVPSHAD